MAIKKSVLRVAVIVSITLLLSGCSHQGFPREYQKARNPNYYVENCSRILKGQLLGVWLQGPSSQILTLGVNPAQYMKHYFSDSWDCALELPKQGFRLSIGIAVVFFLLAWPLNRKANQTRSRVNSWSTGRRKLVRHADGVVYIEDDKVYTGGELSCLGIVLFVPALILVLLGIFLVFCGIILALRISFF